MGSKSDEIDQAIQGSRQGLMKEGEAYVWLIDYREPAQLQSHVQQMSAIVPQSLLRFEAGADHGTSNVVP